MNEGWEETPKLVNFRDPLESLTLQTPGGPVVVDMQRFAQAAKALGLGEINKGDVLSIGAFKNARGQWVPNYATVRIERHAEVED